MAGWFITFEGIDGVGKSTQIERLTDRLTVAGHEVVNTREPGGTDLGVEIRHLLLHRKGEVTPRAEALLYAADRAQNIATVVRPALSRGAVVIGDRYLDSSVAYQGAARALSLKEVRDLSLWAVEDLLPDLTVLLDLPAELAAARRAKTGAEPDRLEREKVEFFEAARLSYLQLASAEPERFLLVDAATGVDEMAAVIWGRVQELLG